MPQPGLRPNPAPAQTELSHVNAAAAAGDGMMAGAEVSALRLRQSAHVRCLRQQIAADPGKCFADADADKSDDLVVEEWDKICQAYIDDTLDPGTARLLFDEIAQGSDRISNERFFQAAEEYRTVRHFVDQSECLDLLVNGLISMVRDKRPHLTPQEGAEGGSHEVLRALAQVSEQDARVLLPDLATALCKQAKVVTGQLAARAEKGPAADTCDEVEAKQNKFANLPEAAYGSVSDFHRGLEVVGVPHPQTMEEMIKEFKDKDDSREEFEAWNSGKNVTTPEKEIAFVISPFKSVSKDSPPEQWEKTHHFGGDREPIRLEVFDHATGARRQDLTFTDYKNADKREESDPLWLHPAEVDLVKVVLLRFIKGQLDAASLRAAFEKKKGVHERIDTKEATAKANKIVKTLVRPALPLILYCGFLLSLAAPAGPSYGLRHRWPTLPIRMAPPQRAHLRVQSMHSGRPR